MSCITFQENPGVHVEEREIPDYKRVHDPTLYAIDKGFCLTSNL